MEDWNSSYISTDLLNDPYSMNTATDNGANFVSSFSHLLLLTFTYKLFTTLRNTSEKHFVVQLHILQICCLESFVGMQILAFHKGNKKDAKFKIAYIMRKQTLNQQFSTSEKCLLG